jgi:uncharacterized protein (TIGR01244 family)
MTNLLVSILSLFGVAMSEPNSDSIVTRHGDVWLASQPSEADLDGWAAAGASLVINSRTPQETAGLPFNLRAAVESRGMRYVELPIGGASGADPALTPQLTQLLQSTDGPVVMHCRSGTRSAHLYAAHLMSLDPSDTAPFDTMGWTGGRDMGMVHALTPDPTD